MEKKNSIINSLKRLEQNQKKYNYKYKAYFEDKNYPVAIGTIDAESKEKAEKILFGMCGTWFDEDGKAFDAGCPVDVEIVDEEIIDPRD